MKTYLPLLLLAALLIGGCQSVPPNPTPASESDVTVNFQDPDKFADVRESFGGPTSQYYLDLLSQYVKKTAANRMTAGQKLTVTFTDIDLAGDFVPTSPNMDTVRIIKAIYIPRMNLRFQLTDAKGAILKEGERRLTDLNFQQNFVPLDRNQPLYHDKQLLDTWLRQELKP